MNRNQNLNQNQNQTYSNETSLLYILKVYINNYEAKQGRILDCEEKDHILKYIKFKRKHNGNDLTNEINRMKHENRIYRSEYHMILKYYRIKYLPMLEMVKRNLIIPDFNDMKYTPDRIIKIKNRLNVLNKLISILKSDNKRLIPFGSLYLETHIYPKLKGCESNLIKFDKLKKFNIEY